MPDSRIDQYFLELPKWQQSVCKNIRSLIHQADPMIEETIKRTDRPYFVLDGNICALQSTKDHINVFIYDPIAPDRHNIINQGKENSTARSIQIYERDIVNEAAFVALIKSVVKNNKAGGWRKIKSNQS